MNTVLHSTISAISELDCTLSHWDKSKMCCCL